MQLANYLHKFEFVGISLQCYSTEIRNENEKERQAFTRFYIHVVETREQEMKRKNNI